MAEEHLAPRFLLQERQTGHLPNDDHSQSLRVALQRSHSALRRQVIPLFLFLFFFIFFYFLNFFFIFFSFFFSLKFFFFYWQLIMCGLLIAMGVINQVDADAIVLDELRILPARHPEVQDSDRKP